jgi:hypothetical protein
MFRSFVFHGLPFVCPNFLNISQDFPSVVACPISHPEACFKWGVGPGNGWADVRIPCEGREKNASKSGIACASKSELFPRGRTLRILHPKIPPRHFQIAEKARNRALLRKR